MTTTAAAPADDRIAPTESAPDVEAEESAWRYKGSAPFGDAELDRRLFCGRKQEATTVLHSILSHDLLLVYAVSGMGKTSLLSAGVFEPLRERGYWPIIVRLNDPSKRIVELIDERIRSADAATDDIEISRNPALPPLDAATATLWDLLAGLEVWKGNSLQRPVLVFDQFEELFTLPWDDQDRAEFIVSFGEVIRRHRSEPHALSDFDWTEGDAEPAEEARRSAPVAPPPPNIKVVLVMREDSLGELERLAADVPQILQHRFRLEGLDPEQAMAAITEPAQVLDPNLKSHTFRYQDEAAATILEFLRSRQERGRTVTSRFAEPPQLQIICEHIERSILPGKRPPDDPDAITEITDADLGGQDGLQRILRDFYRTKLLLFTNRQERHRVRDLCETGLITPSRRRLSLEQESIEQQFHVSKATLDKLVEHRVLRVETRLDSSYYELAHDTMVTPILDYRESAAAARRRKMRSWVGGVAAVAIVAVLVGLALILTGGEESPPPAAVDEQILVGDTVENEITAPQDLHLYEFERTTDDPLVVAVQPSDGFDVGFDVTDPSDTIESGLSYSSTGEVQHVILVGGDVGAYRVAVRGVSGTGSYELTVTPADVEELDGTTPVEGRIAGPGDFRLYGFDATTSPTKIVLNPGRNLDAILTVKDSNQLTVPYDVAAEDGDEVATSTLLGRHVVLVSGWQGSTGEFELTFETPPAEAVAVGRPASGTVDASGEPTYFQFDATAGEALIVQVSPSDENDVWITMIDPTGIESYADSFGANGTELIAIGSAQAGRHTIVVNGSGGPFEVTLESTSTQATEIGAPVTGQIDSPSDAALFQFDADGGEALLVRVQPSEGKYVQMQLLDPDGALMQSDAVDAELERPAQVAIGYAQPGTYTIVVVGSAGTFDLSVEDAPIVELEDDEVVEDSIDETNDLFIGEFTLHAGESAAIEVDPADYFDPVLQVTGSDEATSHIDESGSGGDEALELPAQVTETTYRVVVTGFAGMIGQYELTLDIED